MLPRTEQAIDMQRHTVRQRIDHVFSGIEREYDGTRHQLMALRRVLVELDPKKVLERGYALVRGVADVGGVIEIEKYDTVITAEVLNVSKK